MKVVLIAAVSKNNVIANNGKIPWHSSDELGHFKNTTTSFPVIMGRKTWESIGKTLENRLNIVLSRDSDLHIDPEEVKIFKSILDALDFCKKSNYQKAFIIGGSEIFHQSIKLADELIISKMKKNYDGDTFFPEIDGKFWKENSSCEFTEFVVHYYIRT